MNAKEITERMRGPMSFGSDQKILFGSIRTISDFEQIVIGSDGYHYTGAAKILTPFGTIELIENDQLPPGACMIVDKLAPEHPKANGILFIT